MHNDTINEFQKMCNIGFCKFDHYYNYMYKYRYIIIASYMYKLMNYKEEYIIILH